MGYGLPLFGDRFTGTPNAGFGLSDGGARDWRIGWRLTSAVPDDPGFEVNLDAELWSPGSPLFQPPEHIGTASDPKLDTALEGLLDRYAARS